MSTIIPQASIVGFSFFGSCVFIMKFAPPAEGLPIAFEAGRTGLSMCRVWKLLYVKEWVRESQS